MIRPAGFAVWLVFLGLTSPAVAQERPAVPLAAAGLGFDEAVGGSCYRPYHEGGRMGDRCPFSLGVHLSTIAGMSELPSRFDIGALQEHALRFSTPQPDRGVNIRDESTNWGSEGGPALMVGDGGNNLAGCEKTEPQPKSYEGAYSASEFTPDGRFRAEFNTTLGKRTELVPGVKFVCEFTEVSGWVEIPMPGRFDSRRPTGLTNQEVFRGAFNMMFHMKDALDAAAAVIDLEEVRAARDAAAAEAAAQACDCSCVAYESFRQWQQGKSCDPVCVPPWWERDCALQCDAMWNQCPSLTVASTASDLTDDQRRLVELMTAMQNNPSPQAYKTFEEMARQLPPEQVKTMLERYEAGDPNK